MHDDQIIRFGISSYSTQPNRYSAKRISSVNIVIREYDIANIITIFVSKLYKDSNYVNFEFMRRFLASA